MKHSNYLGAAIIVVISLACAAEPALSNGSQAYKEVLARGVRQMEKKDYQGAVATFTEVLRDNPAIYDAYLDRAASRMELNDFEGALADYDQAVKINPNVVESYLKRAELEVKQADLPAAIADYNQALRLNPKDADALMSRGAAYKANGDFAKAIDDYSTAQKLQPAAMEPIEERADCRMKAYEFDAAISDYNYLLKNFKSKSSHLHFNLGRVYLLKGDKAAASIEFSQAIAYYTKSIKTNRKQPKDLLQRGLAYSMTGELDKAIVDVESASAMLPGDAPSRALLGHLRLAKEDYKGAIRELDEALKIDPKMGSALMDRGSAYSAQGELAAAQKDLDAALAGEKSADALLTRASVRLSMGDSSGASADAQMAKTLTPKSIEHKKQELSDLIAKKESDSERDLALAQSMEQLALLELADNNPDTAESLIKKAIEIEEKKLGKGDPKLAYSLMMLGRVNLKKRSPLRAEALFRAALARLKNNPDGSRKYAVFNLEDCARSLIQSSSMEEAGAILVDTRLARTESALSERAFTGDASRKAERALEAYKLKKKKEQKEEVAQKPPATAEEDTDEETVKPNRVASAPPAITAQGKNVNRPIRDKWAVIVGISNFKDSSINLHYSAKDARDFYDFLVKEKDFAPDHVQLLTDEAATRANILSLLGNKWLPRVAEPDDLVLFYFSSHGSPSSLDVGGVNYLVAHDTDPNDLYATAIAMQDLTSIIKTRVHSDRVMILLDACHSGAVAPSAKGIGRAANVNVDPIVQGTGQLVLSSSSPDQQSWESKRYQGSVFTKHLIDGLKRNGKMTRLGDAFTYLNEEVQREVLRDRGTLQNPIMKSKWEGKDLVIGVPPAAPSHGIPTVELPDAIKAAGTGKPGTAAKADKHKGPHGKSKGPSAKRAK